MPYTLRGSVVHQMNIRRNGRCDAHGSNVGGSEGRAPSCTISIKRGCRSPDDMLRICAQFFRGLCRTSQRDGFI